jgi:hypothetical protein
MAKHRSGAVVALLGRLLLSVVGFGCVAWGTTALPRFQADADAIRMSKELIEGRVFGPDILDKAASSLELANTRSVPDSREMMALAVMRIRLAQEAIERGDRLDADTRLAIAREAIVAALTITPGSSFLWFALFVVEHAQQGFDSVQLGMLRMSYQLGPSEGWIAIRRNRLALELFSRLDADLEGRCVREFAQLVGSGFFVEAADLVAGPGWPIHELLLAQLRPVEPLLREKLARILYFRGYDVTVPGVAVQQPRPWQ